MNHNSAQSKIYHIKVDSLEPLNAKTTKKEDTPSAVIVKKNSLSGLLAHYNSDSETEDVNDNNKLDVKVDSFLQEINEINKPVEKKSSTVNWQECYDESTGYPYYWNVETNQVTWEIPPEYKAWLEKNNVLQNTKVVENVGKTDKQENKKETNEKGSRKKRDDRKNNKKDGINEKTNNKEYNSDDEKIVMITSFCEDSTDDETEKAKVVEGQPQEIKKDKSPVRVHGPHVEDIPKEVSTSAPPKEEKKQIIETIKEEVDETVILARLRTQAKVLQELDGELPESVDRLLNSLEKEKNEITPSLSLVAGYGDDSDPEDPEPEQPKSLFPIPEPQNDIIQTDSTLFPATKPIDISQFAPPEIEKNEESESVDTKIFKRKKRIAFDVLPAKVEKKLKTDENEERLGFGFKPEENSNSNDIKYINFKKGGVAFVKSEVLEPTNNDASEDMQRVQEIIKEKVLFLCEGKGEVSAVQIMSVQLQTLEAAYKAGGLTEKYFFEWLRETNRDIGKLEKDATPDGWQCEWDRSNQRYYYRNIASGDVQWEYPEADIVGGGEAMDICSTPPPEDVHHEQDSKVPSPPEIVKRSPTPPPPPIITEEPRRDEYQPPLPPMPLDTVPPPPPPPSITSDQPLPPGVDPTDAPYVSLTPAPQHKEKRDSFGSELDSFYSDIAMIEATSTTETKEITPQEIQTENIEVPIKKKKKKSKLGQGITMKKKNVSTLVEKWKKVQNDYL